MTIKTFFKQKIQTKNVLMDNYFAYRKGMISFVHNEIRAYIDILDTKIFKSCR